MSAPASTEPLVRDARGHSAATLYEAAQAERVEAEVASITLVAPKVVTSQVAVEPVLNGALLTALDAVRDEVFGSTTG